MCPNVAPVQLSLFSFSLVPRVSWKRPETLVSPPPRSSRNRHRIRLSEALQSVPSLSFWTFLTFGVTTRPPLDLLRRHGITWKCGNLIQERGPRVQREIRRTTIPQTDLFGKKRLYVLSDWKKYRKIYMVTKFFAIIDCYLLKIPFTTNILKLFIMLN